MTATVSVIIPTYNRAAFVPKAVESVLAQNVSGLQIIVIDDGSTDATEKALAPFRSQITLIKQKNGGAANARNTGIAAATGDHLAFLDSDDEWLPGKIACQMRDLEQTGAILHATNALLVGSGMTRTLFETVGYEDPGPWRRVLQRPLALQIHHGVARLQCILVRKSAVIEAGLFINRRRAEPFEDQDLACRLALLGPWCINSEPAVMIWRRREDLPNLSEISRKSPEHRLRRLIALYRRLASSPLLSPDEKRMVKDVQSSYEGMLGVTLIENGAMDRARTILWHSTRANPRAAAWTRWLVSLLPAPIARIPLQGIRVVRGLAI